VKVFGVVGLNRLPEITDRKQARRCAVETRIGRSRLEIRMPTFAWTKSVVSRLVISFCIGGLILSLGLGVIEYYRSLRMMELSTSQQMVMLEQNLQQVLRSLIAHGDTGPIATAMEIFSQDPRVRAVKLATADGATYSAGPWPQDMSSATVWSLTDGSTVPAERLDLSRPTVMEGSFVEAGKQHSIRLLIDGPYIRHRMRVEVINQLSSMWIVLSMLTLLGLLLLRRWLAAPLGLIMGLTKSKAPANLFEETATDMPNEFGELAGSIGRMLRGLDTVTSQLRVRERAFQHLYQFAPAAMISIGSDGRILRANRRAAELLAWADETSLVGMQVLAFIRPEDRAVFRQCVDRLEVDKIHRCELRLEVDGRTRHASVELAAGHDEDGTLSNVRLSLVDISDSKALMQQVSEHRRLLDLVVNHMSDAILLVGADGRVITANKRLAQLQRLMPEALEGQPYDPVDFWARLELLHPAAFEQRMAQISASLGHAVQEQFETRDGAFLFQVIPVCDELNTAVAQLWVVQEVSAQLRSKRLLEQQAQQLRSLQRVGLKLHSIETMDELLTQVVSELQQSMEIEAIGVAMRGAGLGQRCTQLIWQGGDRSPLPSSAALSQAVSDQLMPRALTSRATSLWTDLTQQHAAWSGAFSQAGLESIAATALLNRDQTQGIVWVARRGGKRIEPHHLYMLEALAPMLATAFDNVQLRQQLNTHQLSDPVTNLPSRRLLNGMIARLVNRPGHPWSLLVIDLDRFNTINTGKGHAVADEILRRVARQLRECCRASDQIVRQDNDQFVMLCPDLETPIAAGLAERIRVRIAAMPLDDLIGDSDMRLTCSIGVAGSPQDHTRGELTLDVAMERLSTAKAAGRNRVETGIDRVKTRSA
jgi:diguanylate cyclase (GGDEF)-like protein/PAS domain S-box-containing protein